MSIIAHQRYAELTDERVYLDTLEFNAKAHYAILPGLRNATFLSKISNDVASSLIYRDVSVAGTGHRIDVPSETEGVYVYRRQSAMSFDSDNPMSFSEIKALISVALMAQPTKEDLARMPYPSGGALYSVQTFLCRTMCGNDHEWPDGDTAYQVLPLSRSLESLSCIAQPAELFDALSGGSPQTLGRPSFALVYGMYVDKALFKYRYRGYRLAMMEAGSMYQRVTSEVDARGLRTRVWAGFSDYRVAAVLGLDVTHVLPLVVQFVGN